MYYFILKSSDLHTTAHCRQKLTVMFGPAYRTFIAKKMSICKMYKECLINSCEQCEPEVVVHITERKRNLEAVEGVF